MIRSIRTAVALFYLSISGLPAQEAVPTQMEFRLLAFSRELRIEEAYARDPAAEENAPSVPSPITGYLNHEFVTVPLKTRKVSFTTKPDHKSLGRPGELIGEVRVPDKVKSAILLFLPGTPGEKNKSRIMVIDDSKGAFPAGSFHITNLSPLPVRLMLENKTFEFSRGKTIVVEDPPVRDGQMSGMRAWVRKEDKWTPVATSLWAHPGNSRGVKVFFQDPVTGRIQLRSFDDVPPREPRETAKAPVAP